MGCLTIELPDQHTQTTFNLERWAEIVADPSLAKIEGRIEMDRFGHIIMSPPPAAQHGFFQIKIGELLSKWMLTGRVCSECPISTANGVRAADVAWASEDCLQKLGEKVCFPVAPEICVEIMSPSNSRQEIDEKMALYFNAGAGEVWLCSTDGKIQFYKTFATKIPKSLLCPNFPAEVKLSP